MPVPAAPGSRVGFFQQVLADIGDQQSVMGDLSTFSAHLANLSGILDLPPFTAVGQASSFFDVFFRVQVGTNFYVAANSLRMAAIISPLAS